MDEPTVQTPETAIVKAEPTLPDEMSHIQQNATDFVPSTNQIKWVQTAIAKASSSPSQIADEIGMDRSNYYKWMEDPRFRAWWENQWATYYSQVKHRLIESGVKQAQTDHSWWRDMMGIFGLMKPQDEDKPAPQNTINIMAQAFGKKGGAE